MFHLMGGSEGEFARCLHDVFSLSNKENREIHALVGVKRGGDGGDLSKKAIVLAVLFGLRNKTKLI